MTGPVLRLPPPGRSGLALGATVETAAPSRKPRRPRSRPAAAAGPEPLPLPSVAPLKTVVHITTNHTRDDIRVFLKECLTLQAHGYDVHLLVADGLGNSTAHGVTIHDLGFPRGRLQRFALSPWKCWRYATRLPARIYHLHDPELLGIALPLGLHGRKVVYDSHEDVPRALLSRDWIPSPLRIPISRLFELLENFVAARLSAIVAATPNIGERFSKIRAVPTIINNYPLSHELIQASPASTTKPRAVCYIGAISAPRGIREIVKALELADARLILAGSFETLALEEQVRRLSGWAKVDFRGSVSRVEAQAIMQSSRVGLVLFHPEPNHVEAQPNKMFEYMSAGLPVLASRFPLWESLIRDADSGLCVDPLDPSEIAAAMTFLLDSPQRAAEMGARGRAAVASSYNWDVEAPKLIELYRALDGRSAGT